MIIRKLKLTNFRGIKKGEIELSDLTIILGSNDSGKTTILEALFLLPNPFRYAPYSQSLMQQQPQQPSSMSAISVIHELHKTLNSVGYAFLLHNYDPGIQAKVEWDNGNLEIISTNTEIYFTTNLIYRFPTRGNIQIRGRTIQYFGKVGFKNFSEALLADSNRNITIAPESLLITSELSKFAYFYFYNNWTTIVNMRITRKIAKDISRFVWEDFTDITIEPHLGGTLSIFGLLRDGSRIRLGDIGSGAQMYIVARMLYEIYNPQIILWDDIEAHLNPRLLVNLAEWFVDIVENNKKQVIVTTHSLEAAKIIAELYENTKILLISIENGLLKSKSITLNELEEFASAGIDVRVADALIL